MNIDRMDRNCPAPQPPPADLETSFQTRGMKENPKSEIRNPNRKKGLKNLQKRGGIWYFRKLVNGKRSFVSLNTADVELAKSRRNELSKKALNEKWAEIDGIKTKRDVASIGDVLARYAQAKELQLGERTMEDYMWALRLILKRVKGLESVENLSTEVLSAELVREWQRLCLGTAREDARPTDKMKADSAAVSANSVLRQARSVFSKRALAMKVYQGLTLPDLHGFLTAPRLQELPRDDYHKPDEELLRRIFGRAAGIGERLKVRSAKVLADGQGVRNGKHFPWAELLVIFRLCSEAGLRKGEVCGMKWSWLLAQGHDGESQAMIVTKFDEGFVTKGKRVRVIPVRADLENELRKLASAECGVRSAEWKTGPEDRVLRGSRYEQEGLFRLFGKLLKRAGWVRRQKAHELRKIFASDFLENATPYDAQHVLGHRDLKTTARYAARRSVQGVDQRARYNQ